MSSDKDSWIKDTRKLLSGITLGPARARVTDPTHGPAYDRRVDESRITDQRGRILRFMLRLPASMQWMTLREIEIALGYPQSSISAQLRHLRKERFGSYRVEKRRREIITGGTWEYRVRPPVEPLQLTMEDARNSTDRGPSLVKLDLELAASHQRMKGKKR